ncbi:heterokaryon incompatibility protein-domain-containing protein [Pyrenochaeta sp. MPI-SDFR-AT-0127]|nr:heterokaryon incompatibility protein-domain-containing protein [Pyrenochaeta sp. MPI-SDFR-AT-0127]
MRLINATTLKLQSFIDDSQIPRYAILSHTWGTEEVTFEQFQNAQHVDLERTLGFQKILLASQQTLRDGLGYVWVDTCCIDKTSSAELSESINSMFRWYRNAAVCYAYLDDVGVLENAPEPFVDKYGGFVREYIEEEELARAKWFTRGWTLQELLAPDKLHFYDRAWRFVGDKIYLEPKLARITGISIEAFDPGNKLDNYSVATRMSWAASRKTTRAEDMAYCLLGLFDVNMPLLYGEGGQKAFRRLQQEILENSSDCSIFSWVNLKADVPSWSNNDNLRIQHHSAGGRSIFANSPQEFRSSGGIQSSHTGEIVSTSIGVKIELPIFSLPHTKHLKDSRDQDLFVVLIRWINAIEDEGSGEYRLMIQRMIDADGLANTGLVVRRCHKGRLGAPDLFLRHEGYGLIQYHRPLVEKADFRQMYLCKKVPDGNLLRRLGADWEKSPVVEEPRPYPEVVGLPRTGA